MRTNSGISKRGKLQLDTITPVAKGTFSDGRSLILPSLVVGATAVAASVTPVVGDAAFPPIHVSTSSLEILYGPWVLGF